MDNAKSSKCGCGWASGTSMGLRIRCNSAPTSCPTSYCHSTTVQTILSDGSILGNLACTIPEAITTLRGKAKLQKTQKMEMERMILIDKEITASNARKNWEELYLKSIFFETVHPLMVHQGDSTQIR